MASARALGLALAVPEAPIAAAAPLAFDCDVPPDRSSSVSMAGSVPFAMSGLVTARLLRSGRNLPLASIWIGGKGGDDNVVLRFFAASADAKALDVRLVLSQGGARKEVTLGSVPVDDNIRFSMDIGADGKAQVTANELRYAFDASFLAEGDAILSCSTGQFKFSDVEISAGPPR